VGTVRDGGGDVLVTALANGMTYAAAASLVGVSERTVKRRMRDAAFRDRVEAARRRRTASVAERLSEAADSAVTVLSEILADSSVPPGVRARAALGVLDQLGRRSPVNVDVSGGLAVDVSNMSAEQARDALVVLRTRITEMLGDQAEQAAEPEWLAELVSPPEPPVEPPGAEDSAEHVPEAVIVPEPDSEPASDEQEQAPEPPRNVVSITRRLAALTEETNPWRVTTHPYTERIDRPRSRRGGESDD